MVDPWCDCRRIDLADNQMVAAAILGVHSCICGRDVDPYAARPDRSNIGIGCDGGRFAISPSYPQGSIWWAFIRLGRCYDVIGFIRVRLN